MGYGLRFSELLPPYVREEFQGLVAYLRKYDTATDDTSTHAARTDNPHATTAAQVGAPTLAVFQDHSARHETGGADEIAVTNLTGVAAGVYTPTLTNTTNLGASTAYQCQYLRLGSVVMVSGRFDADPTATGAVLLGLSLPVASNFGAVEDLGGVAFASGIAGQGAAIEGDVANDRASVRWIAVDTTNQPHTFVLQYRVI